MELLKVLRRQWDRTLAVTAALVGLVALLLGYRGVSGSDYLVEQIPFLVSGAVFGLFALGLGAVLWISADLRDEWRKLDDLEVAVRALAEPVETDAPVAPADGR